LDIDVTVIGGGIVGCAVASELSGRGLTTVLLEMEAGLARSTTSRNSEVCHGGMYYPTGSMKARFCVEGRHLLKEFCQVAGVGYRECGKLIVATDDSEVSELERLLALGQANGVEDLRLVAKAELKVLEPDIDAMCGLLSPRTGILDAEGAAQSYAKLAESRGAQVMTGARATALDKVTGGWRVTIAPMGGKRTEGWTHTSRLVINTAGLWADRVAALAGIDIAARGWRQHLTKGNYFAVADRHAGRVRHLVYPVPPADALTLGVHVCLDLGGQMKLGPDLQKYDHDLRDTADGVAGIALDYGVDPGRREAFFAGAHRFLPWLTAADLTPAMCGLRPKLSTTGMVDFVVCREEEPELMGLINLVGIESPGLTGGPALAREVGRLVAEMDS